MSMDMGRSLEGLTPQEKLIHYRLFAQDALEKAQRATVEDMRAGYLSMATAWHNLAAEMERTVRSSAAFHGSLQKDRFGKEP